MPSRLAGVAREWDSWANWLPKSKSLYLTGRFDLEFLRLVPQILSYPPGPATIQAGRLPRDGVCGHDDAARSLLVHRGRLRRRRDRPARGAACTTRSSSRSLLALLVAPSLVDWITTVYADLPLGYLIAVAALLLVLWIEEKEPWQLGAATCSSPARC